MHGRARFPHHHIAASRENGRQALLLTAVAASFILNMAFVVVSRTALVTLPVMLAVFAMAHLKWRTIVLLFVATSCSSRWRGDYRLIAADRRRRSPATTSSTRNQTARHRSGCGLNSGGSRCGFFAEAPVIGHGTGSTRGLFEAVATHGSYAGAGAGDRESAQPDAQRRGPVGHVGVVILYAMWISHLLLFRGEGSPPGSA